MKRVKTFLFLIVILLFQNCSFDNKSNIWKNKNTIEEKDKDLFENFESLQSINKPYNEIKKLENNIILKLDNIDESDNWSDIFYSGSNNFNNFKYRELNQIKFKGKKLTKNKLDNNIFYQNDYIVTTDQKGNIFQYSITENKVINKFSFYKKKYKRVKKNLNLIIEKNIVYVADNIGYLYAIDLINNKYLWAKNYKIPFRSNIKIFDDKLITSNQDNILYFFDKTNGEILKSIPTEESIVKNQFKNNISLNKESIFFINTYGSIYSINKKNMRIKWFINLNQSLELNASNLFSGTEIVNYGDKLVISSSEFLYIIDINSGLILHKKKIILNLKPIISNNYGFFVSKNNLLISIDLRTGKILYSYNINQQIAEFLDIKKKSIEYKNIYLINDSIYIFLKNSYVLKFNVEGKIKKVIKLNAKIKTNPIFVNGSIIYLNQNNNLIILD